MNWNGRDIGLYLKEKEYIDTLVIPLLPLSFNADMMQMADQGENVQLFATYLEKQFKGRMLFTPPFTYMGNPAESDAFNSLKEWENHAKENGFSYVFFLTADNRWKEKMNHYQATFIYLPVVPLGDMDDAYKHSLIEDQLKRLMPDIVAGWQSN